MQYLNIKELSEEPTFHEFVKEYQGIAGCRIRCHICNGSGKVRNSAERDPIEGYKMANWYSCENCDGEGYLSEEESRKLFDVYVVLWMATCEDRQKYNDLARKINAKLTISGITESEWNFIRTGKM